MPISIDQEQDTILISLPGVEISQRREVAEGVVAGFDDDRRVVELLIRKASRRKNTLLSGVVETIEDVRRSRGPITKQPHYVWAFHLRAWNDDHKKISCLFLRRKFCQKISSEKIARQTLFYKVSRLTKGDMTYLNWLVDEASLPGLSEENRSTIYFFQEIYDVQDLLKELGLGEEGNAVFGEHVKFAEIMLGERYHGAIENEGKPFLEKLRAGNTDFAKCPEDFHKFIFFLCHQLFRTAKMRSLIVEAFKRSPISGHDPKRTGPIEQFIYANNVSIGMIAESHKYNLILLKNTTCTPYITGDQPVINLRKKQSNDMRLYYPISPSTALMICTDEHEDRFVSVIEVELLNYNILEACDRQIYGVDCEYLTSIASIGKLDL